MISKMTENHPSLSGAVPGFISRWSKVNVVAEKILRGPRSVTIPSFLGDCDCWLEPLVRLEERIQNPLHVETISLFGLPGKPKETSDSRFVLRIANWSGEVDRKTCRSGDVAFPTTTITFYIVPLNAMPDLDRVFRALDNGLAHTNFHIDGFVPKPGVNPPSSQEPKLFSGEKFLTLWARGLFQELSLSWHEADTAFVELTSCWQQAWETLKSLLAISQETPKEKCFENYQVASEPTLLARWLNE
jgi:hypothetical protein